MTLLEPRKQSWFYQTKMGKGSGENIFQLTHYLKGLHTFIQNLCFHCPHTFRDTERDHEVLSQNNSISFKTLLDQTEHMAMENKVDIM